MSKNKKQKSRNNTLKEDLTGYFDYCKSNQERQVFEMLNKGVVQRVIAETIGINERSVRRIKRRVLDRAAVKGYAPEYGLRNKIPDNLMLKGTSTLYKTDEHGNQVKALEWIKTNNDAEVMVEVMEGVIEALSEDIPRNTIKIANKPRSETLNSDLMNLHIIADYHLGMFAWHELNGESSDWTTDRAEEFIIEWFRQGLEQAPSAETGVLVNLGDFFTSDSTDPVTPMSKHLLDVDVKFQQIIRSGTRVIRQVMEMMREKYKHVVLYNVAGNHDFSSTMWLKEFFAQFYEGCDDVTVDRSADIYHAHEFGDCSLFFHHGHKRRLTNISDVLVSKFRDIFGRTKFSYAHLGHLHHAQVKETGSMVIEQHRTMIPADAYASNGGWQSGRSAYVITYHKNRGEVNRINISSQMVEDSLDGL